MVPSNLQKKIASQIPKIMKLIGIKPADIIELIEEVGIEKSLSEKMKKIAVEKGKDSVVLVGFPKEDTFNYSLVSLVSEQIEGETKIYLKDFVPVEIFGKIREQITATEVIKEMVLMYFDTQVKGKKFKELDK